MAEASVNLKQFTAWWQEEQSPWNENHWSGAPLERKKRWSTLRKASPPADLSGRSQSRELHQNNTSMWGDNDTSNRRCCSRSGKNPRRNGTDLAGSQAAQQHTFVTRRMLTPQSMSHGFLLCGHSAWHERPPDAGRLVKQPPTPTLQLLQVQRHRNGSETG